MICLLLAVASSAAVSVAMRASERAVRGTMVMFAANYAVCFAISRFYMGGAPFFASPDGMGIAVGLGVASGFLYLGSFVLLRRSIHYNGVVLSSASMKLGAVLVPVMAAVLFFRERADRFQLWGIVLAVLAILLINIEKGELRHGGKKMLLMLLLAANGLTDTMANIYHKTGVEALKDHYLSCTFLTALLLALVMALGKRERPRPADICCGLLIGVPNFYSARFLLLALEEVPAVVAYPVYSVGAIIAVTLVGLAVFHEDLSRRKMAALALILAALVLLNVS